MKKNLCKVIALMLGLFLIFFPLLSFAETIEKPAPVVMLEQVSHQMLDALKTHHADIKHNQQALYKIVQQILMPYVDENGMAQQVVGREYWTNAQEKDRQLFIQEFIKVVIRTYSAALTSYKDQQINFLPLREDITGKTYLEIPSQILQPGGPTIGVTYNLVLLAGEWKVRDFSVDGVSLVQNYRSQFSEVLAQKGFSGLVADLAARNSKAGL